MKAKASCSFILPLLIALMVAAQSATAQPNPTCSTHSATASANWPQLGFDSCRTRYNPNEVILSPATAGNLTLSYTYPIDFNVVITPVLARGVLYLVAGDDQTLYALNPTTQNVLWTYETGDEITLTPAVSNGLVYVGTNGGAIYALNATTGALVWKYQATGIQPQGSPTVVNGILYFGNSFALYALKADTGALLWQVPAGRIVLTPSVVNGVVYVTEFQDPSSLVVAFNAVTGAFLWETGGLGNLTPPVAINGRLFVGSDNGNLYALNAGNGQTVWSYKTQAPIYEPPAVANGVVYVGSQDATLYAVNAATGVLQWNYLSDNAIQSSPSVANGVLYFGNNGAYLRALRADTGAVLWNYATTNLYAEPLVVNGMVYARGTYHLWVFHLPGH